VHFSSPAVGFAVAGAPPAGGPPAGGVLLRTTDGGQHWRRLGAPPDVQTVCFAGTRTGWLGAGGQIYGTKDGGRTWALAVHGPRSRLSMTAVAVVQCAGSAAAWAELIGPGVASSQQPHVGYHTSGGPWAPFFAEQYFVQPGGPVSARSPGSLAGPFSAVSPTEAVFIDYCSACGYGTAPMDLARDGGALLQPRGNVGGLTNPGAAAFVTLDDGWVAGLRTTYHASGPPTEVSRIVHTADGGRTWQVQYSAAP
jgi:hypothetical protein